MIDKFYRPFIREQEREVEGRAAASSDENVVTYNGKFMCNGKLIDIAVNNDNNPLVCVNDKYKSGLQEYGGGAFKAKRWIFFYKGKLLAYNSTVPFGVSKDKITLMPELDDPKNWDPFTE